MTKIIYWFRNDLRIADNEGLTAAIDKADEVLPVYIFDPRQFKTISLGFAKTGTFRAKFLLESVQNLRDNLKKRGENLIVRIGKPEQILAEMGEEHNVLAIYASKEATQEETEVESNVSKRLKPINIDLELFWQSTLHHPRDLPFWVSRLPDIFTEYRKSVERNAKVRPPLPEPPHFEMPVVDTGKIPEIYELILFSEMPPQDARAVLQFRGGETEAWQRLKSYFWDNDHLVRYKETRNGLLGEAYSSKFSAWLALGCISPRQIYDEVKRYEAQRIANDSTYWLIFELMWRDYFRFVALKYGTRLFKVQGIRHEINHTFKRNEKVFEQWKLGNTGVPFVDANMKELNATGFMSNRGRQNVASYLTKDLKIDWTWGAAYFESLLIDYDVCSNWGNWAYVAGVGNDPREDRYFNIAKQAKMYDPDGLYVKTWR